MGTCNFASMKNFDLWAVSSDRFYSKVCPACCIGGVNGETCDICGADLSSVAAGYDEFLQQIFCDDISADLEEINAGLLFYKISIKSGYYDGLQLYVQLNNTADYAGFTENGLEYGDNESTRDYFDLCRSAAIRKFEAEQRKINRELAKIGRAYGMDKLGVYARFSNGETWYSKIA